MIDINDLDYVIWRLNWILDCHFLEFSYLLVQSFVQKGLLWQFWVFILFGYFHGQVNDSHSLLLNDLFCFQMRFVTVESLFKVTLDSRHSNFATELVSQKIYLFTFYLFSQLVSHFSAFINVVFNCALSRQGCNSTIVYILNWRIP